jgi:hypothetical protein
MHITDNAPIIPHMSLDTYRSCQNEVIIQSLLITNLYWLESTRDARIL